MAAKDRVQRPAAPAKKATPAPAPLQRTPTDKSALTPQHIQTLQRTIGNRAVQRLLAKSERPAAPNAMPAEVQGKMENSFQTDFSEVRVHPDSARADESGATAFTQGNDIHFASGAYQPTSDAGQALLGHELSHVVQQRAGRVQPTGTVDGTSYNDAPALEREADHSGALAARGEPVQMVGQGSTGSGAPVQQYFWGEATILTVGAGLGLLASSLTPLIAAFGLIAVGRYLFSQRRQGATTVSPEQMQKDLQGSKGKEVEDEDKGEVEEVDDAPEITDTLDDGGSDKTESDADASIVEEAPREEGGRNLPDTSVQAPVEEAPRVVAPHLLLL